MSEHESYFLKTDEGSTQIRRITRHGPATCHWHLDDRDYAENVLMQDGTRGLAHCSFEGFWRRPVGDERIAWQRFNSGKEVRWIRGEVIFSDHDARFVEASSSPDLLSEFSNHPLALQLIQDSAFRKTTQDFSTAYALNWTLLAGIWLNNKTGKTDKFTYDGAGQVVASLRACGECFFDWVRIYECPEQLKGEGRLDAKTAEIEMRLNAMDWFKTPWS